MPGSEGWARKLPGYIRKGYWTSLVHEAEISEWPPFPGARGKDRPVSLVINTLNAWRDEVLQCCTDEKKRELLGEKNKRLPAYAMKDGSKPPPLGDLLKKGTLVSTTTKAFGDWFSEHIKPLNEEAIRKARETNLNEKALLDEYKLVTQVFEIQDKCTDMESSMPSSKRRIESDEDAEARRQSLESAHKKPRGDSMTLGAPALDATDEAMLYESKPMGAEAGSDSSIMSLEMDNNLPPRDDLDPAKKRAAEEVKGVIKFALYNYHLTTKCSRIELLKEMLADLEEQQLLSADEVAEEEPTLEEPTYRSLNGEPDDAGGGARAYAKAVVSRMRSLFGLGSG